MALASGHTLEDDGFTRIRGVFTVNQGIPIARIAGIRIQAHWSVLVIGALLAWGVAVGVIPAAAPGTPALVTWFVGAGAALLLIASLTAHELAHSLMARHRGVAVEGITLWVFGGVSHIRSDWGSARTEILVAVVGPAMTLVLTGLFYAIAAGLAAAGAPALAVVVPDWLAVVNFMLLVFNLVPAFPLDGGRILRGILWARRGDRASATASAARGGRAFALLLMAGGVVDFFLTSDIGGIWLVFIGWFLESATRAEQQGETVRHVLEGVTVGDVMSSKPMVVPSWIMVEMLIEQYAMRYHFTTFPIHDINGRVEGLVTLRSMKRVPAGQRSTVRAAEIAIPLAQVPRAAPADLLTDLLLRLGPQSDGRALVFEGDHLVGLVSPSDVARRLQLGELRSEPPLAA
jgi:Zn-dependent protease